MVTRRQASAQNQGPGTSSVPGMPPMPTAEDVPEDSQATGPEATLGMPGPNGFQLPHPQVEAAPPPPPPPQYVTTDQFAALFNMVQQMSARVLGTPITALNAENPLNVVPPPPRTQEPPIASRALNVENQQHVSHQQPLMNQQGENNGPPLPPPLRPSKLVHVPSHSRSVRARGLDQDLGGGSDDESNAPGGSDANCELQRQLRKMNKRLERMEKAKNQAGRPVGSDESPFTREVLDEALPPNFRLPKLDTYDGTTDPSDHIHSFASLMRLHGFSDPILCRAFNTTLRKSAQDWYRSLKPDSISDFETLTELFLKQFVAIRRTVKHSVQLMNVIQGKTETLRAYIRRFNNEMLEIKEVTLDVVIAAMIGGSTHNNFVNSLVEKPPRTIPEVLKRAEVFMNAEETLVGRRRALEARQEDEEERPAKRREEKRGEERGQQQSQNRRPQNQQNPKKYEPRFHNFSALTLPRAEVLYQVQKDGFLKQGPPRMKSDPAKRNKRKFCQYHKDHGHDTEECDRLKDDIEELIRRGHLRSYVRREEERRRDRTPEARTKDSPTRQAKIIHVIAGGHDVGGKRSYEGDFRLADSESKRRKQKGELPLNLSITDEDLRGLLPQSDSSIVVKARIEDFEVRRIMVDTGSSADILYIEAFEKLNLDRKLLKPCSSPLIGFTGHQAPVAGKIILDVTFGDDRRRQSTVPVEFMVVEMESAYNAIIGRPTLCALRAAVIPYCQMIKFPTQNGEGKAKSDQEAAKRCYVASTRMKIPGVKAPTTSVTKETLSVDMLDVRSEFYRRAGTPAEEVEHIPVPPEGSGRTIQIGTLLQPGLRESLISFLRGNLDVFAWSAADMPGVDMSVAMHELNVDEASTPIKQKKRNLGWEKRQAAKEEVHKLLTADFITEVQYPSWLANVVMVPKKDKSWRMCVDFTDLNRACPKDSFPLPNIDQLVDASSGAKLLSFMDAFSGYNQIQMKPSDREKTSFITDEGTFCYRVMPFGLKNAGATYQRLVSKIFKEQIGRNVEVYVDDMLVKSREVEQHVEDLRETFSVLRSCNMKLNPKKCAFGVSSGKFLGFIITSRGIEANPEKVTAILDLREPRNLGDVQVLTGRLTALHRFLSRGADKTLPFFKVLRGARGKDHFFWGAEQAQAFADLKLYIATLPLLSRPEKGEILYMYLAANKEAISSVLVREDEGEQKPVYFISKILKDAELRYPMVEKISYAVLTSARKLRPYFQSHPIIVYSEHPLRRILGKPETSGRLLPWSIELSEFHIEYKPRPAIKAQVLADFIVENTAEEEAGESPKSTEAQKALPPPPADKPNWNLYVDGASNKGGAGAGVILFGPEGLTLKMALKINFPISNNKAEYEAVIAGLVLAIEVGADRVAVHSDSQLVVAQLEGTYEVRDETMKKYWVLVKALCKKFDQVFWRRIPREENEEADKLSRDIFDPEATMPEGVLVDELEIPSTEGSPTVLCIRSEPSWMDPIVAYLRDDILPEDPKEADKVRRSSTLFELDRDRLYRRAYTEVNGRPLLRCLTEVEASQCLEEIHKGLCGGHIGAKAMVQKVIRLGYYWPRVLRDAEEFVKKCDECQKHGTIPRHPAVELSTITCPIPFAQWGMDLLGPFPPASGQRKYIIVLVDYFTKWAECEALATITEKKVESFVWRNIICRFGVPKVLITDHGTQFDNSAFKSFCAKFHIDLRFASKGWARANGQVEVVNRAILRHLKKQVGNNPGTWAEELPRMLWVYRTTYKTPTGETPFRLAYGSEALAPLENHLRTLRVEQFPDNEEDEGKWFERNEEARRVDLDLLGEVREVAYQRILRYQQNAARYHNAKVRPRALVVGDMVLRNAEASGKGQNKGKLSASWEGPYRVRAVIRPGAYKLETLDGAEVPLSWNIGHLKKYYV